MKKRVKNVLRTRRGIRRKTIVRTFNTRCHVQEKNAGIIHTRVHESNICTMRLKEHVHFVPGTTYKNRRHVGLILA